MGVKINTANDWKLAEDPESVLYCSKAGEAPSDVPTWPRIDWVEIFPINKTRLTSDSLLANMDMTARFAKAKMGGIVPKIDDIFKRLRDGTYWVVKLVDVLSFGNEYRLHAIKSTKR